MQTDYRFTSNINYVVDTIENSNNNINYIYDIDGVLADITQEVINNYIKGKTSFWTRMLLHFQYFKLKPLLIPKQKFFICITSRPNFLRFATILWFMKNKIMPWQYKLVMAPSKSYFDTPSPKRSSNVEAINNIYKNIESQKGLMTRIHYKLTTLRRFLLGNKKEIVLYFEDEPNIREYLFSLQLDFEDRFFLLNEEQAKNINMTPIPRDINICNPII